MKPGDQLASTTSTTRVVIVRIPAGGAKAVTCGGEPMVAADPGRPAQPADAEAITLIGKRYVDATEELELLCTYSGKGELSCDGVPMTLKSAKPLPASD
jgi:hypothetical protein